MAVVLVAIYLALNIVVLSYGFYEIATHLDVIPAWTHALTTVTSEGGATSTRSILMIIGLSLLVFPKLALGLSGFETGVAVMPLVKNPHRINSTRKLLASAALIMSFMLIASSFITTVLIPAEEFRSPVINEFGTMLAEGGKANGRALAYLAHSFFGEWFGTAYDISTIAILWFAGASAMAGLLNIVPRYLPRYGMAPEWARATRPLVMVFSIICFIVTWIFKADVNAQGGAYATGVLVLMTSAAIAVTISAWRRREFWRWAFAAIAFVFAYTTIINVYERPDGIRIAAVFIGAIVAASFISRAARTTELRVEAIELDDRAKEFLNDVNQDEIRLVTNRRETGDAEEYRFNEREKRLDNHIPSTDPILFFEVELGDASEFKGKLKVRGVDVEGFRVLRAQSPAVPNAIAALLLHLRDKTGKIPHVYFGWSEGNPIAYLIRYILFGEGDTAPVTREILRQAEPDPEQRPSVHVGG